MIVDDLRAEESSGAVETSMRVRHFRLGSGDFRLVFRVPKRHATPGEPDASPFLVALLPWCLHRREELRIDAPVSARLLARLDSVIDVYTSFFPDFMWRVPVEAPAAGPPVGPGTGATGCFFTRGVDSWHSVLTAGGPDSSAPAVTHLIFVPSFERELDRRTSRFVAHSPSARDRATREIRRCADELELETVFVETNLRERTDQVLGWGWYHGAALAAVALALGLPRTLIASSYMHGELVPYGSHLALDHRFSTERTQVIHHGDASRLRKVARVAREPLARETLKVCFHDAEGNCGECRRCLVTMMQLHAAGALEAFSGRFDAPLDPARVAETEPASTGRHAYVELLHALGDSPFDRALAGALRLAIARGDVKRAAESVAALREAEEAFDRAAG